MTSSDADAVVASDRPLVTVGIPTYNRLASLVRALASACAQTYEPLEIIVSDNGGTDGTKRYLEELAATDQRVVAKIEQVNRGATANFEAVLTAASGQYFMWLADDDRIEPRYIERCLERLCGPDRPALVAGAALYFRDDEFERQEVSVDLTADEPVGRLADFARSVNRNEVFYGVARTADWRQFVPLRNTIAEDWSMVAPAWQREELC